MTKPLISLFILICCLGINSALYASATEDCRSIMIDFISKSAKKENVVSLKNGWSQSEKNDFLGHVKKLDFNSEDTLIIIESLNLQKKSSEVEFVKNYLVFVMSLKESEQKLALKDLVQLDSEEVNSKYVNKFLKSEEKIAAKFKSKNLSTKVEQDRYKELFYGCRALRPNEINKNAAKSYKRFSMALSLGTLGASYAYYNMDKDLNAEWFEKLGYDIGTSLLFSYVGGKVQTNATDTQLTKSLKNYFQGRVIGLTDVAIYDPLFSKEREKAELQIEKLKQDPNYKDDISSLLKSYEERSLYRKYKNELISTLKKLPEGISLGLKGNSIDENNIDWNNLSQSDLDRPEVQEVLVAGAMAQVYQESKGKWIETDDTGLDRYAFNTIYYGAQIPKSIFQTYQTFQMLCMGQDNAKMSFAKAVVFNMTTNFIVNQALYGYRKKAIGQ